MQLIIANKELAFQNEEKDKRAAELIIANKRVENEINIRIDMEEKIKNLAYYDYLTGLPNKRLFNDRLNLCILDSVRNEKSLGVLFLGLDSFKRINDTMGHAKGDELLKMVSKRLTNILRADDIVCRMGGDEFLLILNKNLKDSCTLLYKEGIVDQNIISRDILNPLMHQVNEDLSNIQLINEHVCNKYISMSKIDIATDINMVAIAINNGKTAILINTTNSFIIADTDGGEHRNISEPTDEIGIKGPRNGFIENLEVNLSLIKRD